MSKAPRVIRSMELDEISICGTPAQSLARTVIAKSQPAPVIAAPPSAEGEAAIQKMIAAYSTFFEINKFQHQDTTTMSESHYEKLTKSYAERHGVSVIKAAQKLRQDDPDALASAYDADEKAAIQRRFAEANR